MLRLIGLAVVAIYLAGTICVMHTMLRELNELIDELRGEVDGQYIRLTVLVMFISTLFWPYIVGEELYRDYKNLQN